MKLRDVLIASAVIIVLFVIYTGVGYLDIGEEEKKANETASFSIKEMGRAGEYAYAVFLLKGEANITLVGYGLYAPPKINVINDAEGIDSNRIPELAEKIRDLERYGYEINISDRRMMTNGINIVATGAMPNYVLDAIKTNTTKGVVVYIGRKDWVLRSGSILNESWYDELTEEQKERILAYDGAISSFLDSGMDKKMMDDILKCGWSLETSAIYSIRANETLTRTVEINKSKYLRVIYESGKTSGFVDSDVLPPVPDIILKPQPESIYPWQTSSLVYRIEKSNGTVYFSIYKNGIEETAERLRRVVEGSYFSETLVQKESGYYIIILRDNSGIIGSGILHVKKLDVIYAGRVFNTYYFDIMEDGEPLQRNVAIVASIDNGTKRTYYASNGKLSVNALLRKGENTFNIEIEGKTFKVPVVNKQEGFWDIYSNYGLPGLFMVFVVYVIIRLSKKQTYVLRIGEGWASIRNEIRVKEKDVVEAIRNIKRDARLGDYPITASEFDMAMKRYVTKGAEITEGNSEEILRKLVKKGKLEQYGEYYNFSKEGDIREKALLRQIRELIIENGLQFREIKGGFSIKDFDIVLSGYRPRNRKTIVVFEDENEIKKYEMEMDERELALTRIKQANEVLAFATIQKLQHYL